MKSASVSVLKKELNHFSEEELIDLLYQMIKHSKDNKEFLNFLLFEADFEKNYVEKIKVEIGVEFDGLDTRSWKTMKKSIQRIVRTMKKYIKYSREKETEIEILLYFCHRMTTLKFPLDRNPIILNIYKRQLGNIQKSITSLHEDLQYDYQQEVEELEEVLVRYEKRKGT
jgi:hypothetical protein